jgi:hypothetical protein
MANAQHFGGFGLGASAMVIPPDVSIEGIQLGSINVAVFREGDVR